MQLSEIKNKTKASLTFNYGFLDDLNICELLPDSELFGIEIDTTIGYRPQASAEGPYSFLLMVDVGLVASAIIGTGFLSEMGKDLYNWLSGKILTYIKKHPSFTGIILIKTNDSEIYLTLEGNEEEVKKEIEKLLDLESIQTKKRKCEI